MMQALRAYLLANGFTDVYVDFMPAAKKQLGAIYLGLWAHNVGAVHDGTGVRRVQVQVRRATYAEALGAAWEIFRLLDSGDNETLIHLNDDTLCIARPSKGPTLLERGDTPHATFAFDIALWG